MRILRIFPMLLLVVGVAAPAPSDAAGYYIGDVGTRGTARAGAFIARADSLLAMSYNPAGLSLLRSAHLEADFSLMQFDGEYKRSCPCVDPSLSDASALDSMLTDGFAGRTVRNVRDPQDIEFFGIAYGLPFLDTTIGLAAYGPQSPRRYGYGTDKKPGNQRYSTRGVDLYEAYYALGVALSPLKGLRVGVTGQLYEFGTAQALHLWTNLASTPEDPALDVPTTLSFTQVLRPNWSFGISYDLPLGLTIGGSVLGKRSVRADGTASLELPELATSLGLAVEGEKIEVEVNLPPIWRVGLEYQLPKVFRIEAATVIEAWSVYERAVVRFTDINLVLDGNATPLPAIVIPYSFQDSVSLHVGGELNLLEPYLGVRAGYYFEPSAIPADRKDVSTPDLDKHGISLGLSTSWSGFTLELAAQYIMVDILEVKDSKQTIVAPLETKTYVTTVGNGVYGGDFLVGSASLSFALDGMLDSVQ